MSLDMDSSRQGSAAENWFRADAGEHKDLPLGAKIGSEVVDILIVDDQPEVIAVLRRQMLRKGYTVRTAGDAYEAAAQLALCCPRVILLDLMMPKVDGAAFLKALRQTHSPGALPVIIVTASDQRADMLRCLDAGANDFVMKPVDLDALAKRVEVQIAISTRFRALEKGGALLADTSHAREAVWTWRPVSGEFLAAANFASVCGLAVQPGSFEDWIATLRTSDAKALAIDIQSLRGGKIIQIDRQVLCGQAHDRALVVRASMEPGGDDERVSGAIVDITEPFLRDKLSQLPAEGAFLDRLASRRAVGLSATVLMMDVRRFDEFTLAHGIMRGDDALRVYISAVQRAVAPVGELFRVGPTEFAIIVNPGSGAGRALARDIAGGDQFGVQVGDGQVHRVSSAVGLVTDSIETPEETRFRGKLALRAAVEAGAGTVREYSDDLRENRLRQARIESRLSVALARKAIDVVFQPVADAATNKWLGIEAMPSWVDGSLGQVPQAELMEAADLIGHSFELLEIVARRAFQVGALINAQAPEPMFISVNVPAAAAKNPLLPTLIARLAREEKLDLTNVVLEVSEDDILCDYDACAKVFSALNALGVRVAIDNFGSSYSCLTYLCRVPSQILKVDEAVLDAAEERPDARSLLGTTSRMAKHLGKMVVLSGVAAATQMAVAREVGADMVQGSITSHPLSGDDVMAVIRTLR